MGGGGLVGFDLLNWRRSAHRRVVASISASIDRFSYQKIECLGGENLQEEQKKKSDPVFLQH